MPLTVCYQMSLNKNKLGIPDSAQFLMHLLTSV